MKTILGLRTIHGDFSDRELPGQIVDRVLAAALQAANSSNMQTYSMIVVKDPEKMRKVCGYRGSVMVVFCADYHRLVATAKHLGYDYCPDNSVAFVTAAMNTMLVAQTAVIAAKSLGVDSLLTNGLHRGDMTRLWPLLDLPEKSVFPMIAMILGYPAEEPDHDMGRLNGPGVIHQETYQRLSSEDLDAIVSRYDDSDSGLALNNGWREAGFPHFLDWLHSVWLKGRDQPTRSETQMLSLLKRCGFIESIPG